MSATVQLNGTIQVGGDSCSSCSDGSPRTLGPLTLSCDKQFFQAQTQGEAVIATPGAVGAAWVDLPVIQQLIAVEFLFVSTQAAIKLRIGAAPATLNGASGTFPTGFAGGETFNVTIDGVAVSVAFLIGDQTAAQCAARINSACALAGLATPRATVATSGQLVLTGVATGPASGSVAVTGGTGRTQLGFAGTPSAVGAGADVDVQGIYINQFPRFPSAPTRIQVSGNTTIDIIAAGRTTA